MKVDGIFQITSLEDTCILHIRVVTVNFIMKCAKVTVLVIYAAASSCIITGIAVELYILSHVREVGSPVKLL